jgi:hypothetical protein
MFLLDWYREWLFIKAEHRKSSLDLNKDAKEIEIADDTCASCETLRQQLDIANYEKKMLLERLLEKPEKVEEVKVAPEPVFKPSTSLPWPARRQILEREDRERARAMRNAAQSDAANKKETEELEKELDLASAEREKQGS